MSLLLPDRHSIAQPIPTSFLQENLGHVATLFAPLTPMQFSHPPHALLLSLFFRLFHTQPKNLTFNLSSCLLIPSSFCPYSLFFSQN